MRLTTKGRYAVTAMLDLAIQHGGGPITLADIAQRQGISLSYLEQLFSRLRKRNLVSSVRGPGGGYTLGRDAGSIYVAEVISAVDENVDTTRCGSCAHSSPRFSSVGQLARLTTRMRLPGTWDPRSKRRTASDPPFTC